jgi:hypothetical protein
MTSKHHHCLELANHHASANGFPPTPSSNAWLWFPSYELTLCMCPTAFRNAHTACVPSRLTSDLFHPHADCSFSPSPPAPPPRGLIDACWLDPPLLRRFHPSVCGGSGCGPHFRWKWSTRVLGCCVNMVYELVGCNKGGWEEAAEHAR